MSADNGVYVLKCKDQCRVKHLQAIENISWSYLHNLEPINIVPTRAVEMFGKCKYTRDSNLALHIASKILKQISYCEYGIRILEYPFTWRELKKQAKKIAKLEIEELTYQSNKYGEDYTYEINELNKMFDY